MHNFKVVQWRVRDLASCFHSCHFSALGKELAEPVPRAQGLKGSKVFDSRSDQKGVGREAPSVGRYSSRNDLTKKRLGESMFSEEDYIVFCFGEDGGICLVEEYDSTKACCNNDRVNSATSTTVSSTVVSRKVDEKGNKKMDTKCHPKDDSIKKQPNASKLDSGEPSDSSQSETTSTRSSFAFPELGVEWAGSPVHMPKAEIHDHEYTTQMSLVHCHRL